MNASLSASSTSSRSRPAVYVLETWLDGDVPQRTDCTIRAGATTTLRIRHARR